MTIEILTFNRGEILGQSRQRHSSFIFYSMGQGIQEFKHAANIPGLGVQVLAPNKTVNFVKFAHAMFWIAFTIQSHNFNDAHLQQLVQPEICLFTLNIHSTALGIAMRQKYKRIPLAGRVR